MLAKLISMLIIVPTKVRIWKSRKNYIAVAHDDVDAEFLKKYINQKVDFVINNVIIKARITELKQRSKSYIAIFLPRRLAPTWDELRKKDQDIIAIIVITQRDVPKLETLI